MWPLVTTAPGLLTLTRLVTALPSSQCEPKVAEACHRATFDCSSNATEILIHNGASWHQMIIHLLDKTCSIDPASTRGIRAG